MDAVPAAIGYHGAPDVMLNALPTYHIAGVGVALLTASKGGTSVLYPDFDPAKVSRRSRSTASRTRSSCRR